MSTQELIRIQEEQARTRRLIDDLVGVVARLQERVEALEQAAPKKGAPAK